MKKITVIMPFLNEKNEPIKTIESIYETAPDGLYNILAVDDNSNDFLDVGKIRHMKHVKYLRNKERIGVDGSRQLGIDNVDTPYVFVIDAHMRFKNDNWMEKIIECLEREPNTTWCTTCLGLGYGTMDLNSHKGKYYGADMLFVDENHNPNRPAREVLEPKWANEKQGNEYEIPCILGANYGFSKKWIDYIKGLEGLKMWGSSEPFISMKTWMAGGKCKITKDIEIGHKFRGNAPYETKIYHLVYNKIFLCKTILPEEVSNKLINYLPRDANFKKAMMEIEEDSDKINYYRSYYLSIFKKSIYDYCNRFQVEIPDK